MGVVRRFTVSGIAVALVVCGFLACSGDSRRGEPRVEVSTLFVPPDHKASTGCLRELCPEMDVSDSVIFSDKTSKIRVLPPRLPRNEPYHCHLFQRLGQELLEHVFYQDARGLIEIDLGKYPEPEYLIVTSAAKRLAERGQARSAETEGAKPDEAVLLPYTVSYRIAPAAIATTVLPLQRNRWEVETPQGTLTLIVSSFNRRDQMLTWVDPTRNLWNLFQDNPEVTLPKYQSVVPPRITVEVCGSNGRVWQRSGTFHLPEGIDRLGKAEEKPYMFRAEGRDIIAFAPPPRVDLTLPETPPATDAIIKARFSGVSDKVGLRFVLACAYPDSSKNKASFAARVQTHEITSKTKDATFTSSLAHLEGTKFPLTASIYHHLYEPWALTGGRYNPVPPRGKTVLAQQTPRGPMPRYAMGAIYSSHYDLLQFLGAAGHGGKRGSLLDDYWNSPDGSSPNVAPPPGGGPGVPPVVPPGGPIPPIVFPPPPPPGHNQQGGGFPWWAAGAGGGGGGGGGGGDVWMQGPPFRNRFNCPDGGCLKGKKPCNCGTHPWSSQDLENNANRSANPAPADVTFRGPDPAPGAGVPRGGRVQCDADYAFVGYMEFVYWIDAVRKLHILCPTYVKIGGCVPTQPPIGGGIPGLGIGPDHETPTTSFGSGIGGNWGSTFVRTGTTQTTLTTFEFTQTTFSNVPVGNGGTNGSIAVHTYAFMDPNIQGLTSDAGILAGGSANVSSSMIVPVGWLTADAFTLTNLAQAIQADRQSAQNAYFGRDIDSSGPLWNGTLYTQQSGIFNPGRVNPGSVITPGTTTPPSTTTPPPPSTTTPPPPATTTGSSTS